MNLSLIPISIRRENCPSLFIKGRGSVGNAVKEIYLNAGQTYRYGCYGFVEAYKIFKIDDHTTEVIFKGFPEVATKNIKAGSGYKRVRVIRKSCPDLQIEKLGKIVNTEYHIFTTGKIYKYRCFEGHSQQSVYISQLDASVTFSGSGHQDASVNTNVPESCLFVFIQPQIPENEYEETVRALQNFLNAAGFNAGKADGIVGPKSCRALVAFQEKYKLKITGVLDDQTYAVVKRLLEKLETTASKIHESRPCSLTDRLSLCINRFTK